MMHEAVSSHVSVGFFWMETNPLQHTQIHTLIPSLTCSYKPFIISIRIFAQISSELFGNVKTLTDLQQRIEKQKSFRE
jgi:hypothetical protein